MLNRDYTNGIQNAIRNSLSLDFTPTPNKFEQLPEVVSKGIENWDNAMRKKAYVDALQTGDQEKIDKALASYDADAYQNVLKDREKRQQELDDIAAQRDFQREMMDAQLKNSFALENMRHNNAMGLAQYKAGLNGTPDTNAQRNVQAMIEAGYTPQEAWAMYYGGNNPTLNMDSLGKKGREAFDKKVGENVADEVIAQKQMQTLRPKVDNALKRAKESLENGAGLGQFGGWGWTNEQGGINRANIKNAQAQINTTMRGLLKQMGVGSTELNSAAEAEAYRYMLSPDMPIGQQMQVINNFKQDYLSGDLARDLAQTYGKPQQMTVQIQAPDGRIVAVPESEVQNALAQGGKRI